MSSKAREIRWTKPALDFFLDELQATDNDVQAVNTVLIHVRDDASAERAPVEKDGREELAEIEGEIFVSYDSRWAIYYLWSPSSIIVVRVDLIGK